MEIVISLGKTLLEERDRLCGTYKGTYKGKALFARRRRLFGHQKFKGVSPLKRASYTRGNTCGLAAAGAATDSLGG